jgi:hypothetical protein
VTRITPWIITIFANFATISGYSSGRIQASCVSAAFAERYFLLPPKLRLKIPKVAGYRSFNDEKPQYSPRFGSITSPYLIGFEKNGKIVSKGRRHSQTVFNHEFGHLIFYHNFGDHEDWLKKARMSMSQSTQHVGYVGDTTLNEIVASCDELFADVFAVAMSKNPKAIYSSEDFMLKPALQSYGHDADLISRLRKARDFTATLDVESWTATDPHILLGPARSAFANHSYAIHLLKTDPERLTKLVFDAIQSELNTLAGSDAHLLPSLTVSEQNKRIVKVMSKFLDEDASRNGYPPTPAIAP